ncbi:MAG: isochorismatase family cysteine hydrolase [Chitinophagaceae bacterium]
MKSANTALLVMDMQKGILANYNLPGLLVSTAEAIAHARKQSIPVIYVVLGFRNGFPEINMQNKIFAASKGRFANIDMKFFTQVDPAIAPIANEVIVTKKRFSAFAGSDLEVVLRSLGISHMVLAGISTSGVVLSTLREAADKDYQLTVLSDCCADPDEEVHRVMLTKVFPKQADVITVNEWIVS